MDSQFTRRIELLKALGVQIGEDVKIYSMEILGDPSRITIGSHVEITSHVCIITLCPYWYLCDYFVDEKICYAGVSIGDNTFLGMKAIVNPGAEIGNNCVIGAGAVVQGKVLDGSVLLGNPARVIKDIDAFKKNKINSKYRIDTKGIKCRDKVKKMLLSALKD